MGAVDRRSGGGAAGRWCSRTFGARLRERPWPTADDDGGRRALRTRTRRCKLAANRCRCPTWGACVRRGLRGRPDLAGRPLEPRRRSGARALLQLRKERPPLARVRPAAAACAVLRVRAGRPHVARVPLRLGGRRRPLLPLRRAGAHVGRVHRLAERGGGLRALRREAPVARLPEAGVAAVPSLPARALPARRRVPLCARPAVRFCAGARCFIRRRCRPDTARSRRCFW